jgi:transmembrane sensor
VTPYNSAQFVNEDAIEAVAAGWLVEEEEGFAAGRADAFAQWREADPRHRAALARLQGTQRLLQQLPRVREDERLARRLERMTQPPRRATIIPFPYLKLVAAAAAIALAATLWWQPARSDFQQQFATTADGATKVTLPDNSHIDLSADSNVAVTYDARHRNIALERGEANFSVAKDPSRPFVVAARQVKVQAIGTVFKVRYTANAVEVVVTEGKVQVSRDGASAPEILSALVAGQSGRFPFELAAAGSVSAVAPTPAAATSPADLLKFDGMPLHVVADAFNRRNELKIVVSDDQLAEQLIHGEFPANDPQAFVRLLEGVSSEQTNSIIVLRKAD